MIKKRPDDGLRIDIARGRQSFNLNGIYELVTPNEEKVFLTTSNRVGLPRNFQRMISFLRIKEIIRDFYVLSNRLLLGVDKSKIKMLLVTGEVKNVVEKVDAGVVEKDITLKESDFAFSFDLA